MSDINSWNTTDASNNDTPPDGFPENMAYSEVNNAARAVMGGLKRFFADLNGSLAGGGSADAYTVTLNAGYSAYFDGLIFSCTIPAANATTTPTINVNSIGAKTIVDNAGNAVAIGQLESGGAYLFAYNGTDIRMLTSARPAYSEGTWTATVSAGSGTITLSSSQDLLSYVKIGRAVFVTGWLRVTSVSSPLGTVQITNLPFAVANPSETSNNGACALMLDNLTSAVTGAPWAIFNENTTTLTLGENNGTGPVGLGAKVQANTDFYINGWYQTDD